MGNNGGKNKELQGDEIQISTTDFLPVVFTIGTRKVTLVNQQGKFMSDIKQVQAVEAPVAISQNEKGKIRDEIKK